MALFTGVQLLCTFNICSINLLDGIHCLKCFSHNVSGVESTPVFRWGIVVRTTVFYFILTTNRHLKMGVDSSPKMLCEKDFRQWIQSNKFILQIKHHCHKPFELHIQYSCPPYLLSNVWKASYSISASIFVRCSIWLLYSTDKFISCVVPSPSQWFFHSGKEITIAWTHIGWLRWMFQNLPLPAVQEVHDYSSSSVTPYITTKNDESSLLRSIIVFSWVHTITISSSQWKNHCEGSSTTQGMNLSML